MASYLIRRGWFNWSVGTAKAGNPAPLGNPVAQGATVTIPYDEPMRAAPAVGQFTATVNGVARTINTAVISGGNKLVLTLASAATAGQQVRITYVANVGVPAGRLADAAANFAPNFVTNITAK